MELKDLKTGMRIILRNKGEYIVLKNVITPYNDGKEDMYINIEGGWMSSNNYKNDLTERSNDKEFDIMEVYAQNNGNYLDGAVLKRDELRNMDLIWKREEKRKMTVSEICAELGYDIEIVKED